ncbi:MAG: hypothetical protein ACRD2I_23075, partial [Vicinamibacterales bacterium]
MAAITSHGGRLTRLARAAIVIASLPAAACLTGPDYQRPPVGAPGAFRGAESAVTGTSLADERWSALFEDEVLQ